MKSILIISKNSREVYVGESSSPESLLRMVKSRLRRGQYRGGKYWWIQDRFNQYGGEGIELSVSLSSVDGAIQYYKDNGFRVYTDVNYPVAPKVWRVEEENKVSSNFFVPDEYKGDVENFLMVLESGEYDGKLLKLNPGYYSYYAKVEKMLEEGVSGEEMDNWLNKIQEGL